MYLPLLEDSLSALLLPPEEHKYRRDKNE